MASQSTRHGPETVRASVETDRRHLLSESTSASAATSLYGPESEDGERTPRAGSPAPASTGLHRASSVAEPEQVHQQSSYKGFSSEAAYLEALQAWANGKKYDSPGSNNLVGFYGDTTMEEYASRPPAFQSLGLRKKWRTRKAAKTAGQAAAESRRATVA